MSREDMPYPESNYKPAVCACGHGMYMHNEYGCFEKVGSASCDDAYCSCSIVPPRILAERRERQRQRQLSDPCPRHRRYQIKRPPRTACEQCWRNYIKVNP